MGGLILSLFVEQFLLMFVGIADTFTVSFSSVADVSGVSLVTLFNTVLIFLFTVLTTGGAVISQHIGSKREEDASRTSGQLLMISAVVPLALTVLIVACRVSLLRLLFGRIEADVMSACETYLFITTFSLPFVSCGLQCGYGVLSQYRENQRDHVCTFPLWQTSSTMPETASAFLSFEWVRRALLILH